MVFNLSEKTTEHLGMCVVIKHIQGEEYGCVFYFVLFKKTFIFINKIVVTFQSFVCAETYSLRGQHKLLVGHVTRRDATQR